MAKHTEKVGTIEDFNAPWETDAGEVEIDKAKLKRFIFNLKLGEARALDAKDELGEKLKTAETERDQAKSEASKGDTDGLIAKAEKERDEAKAEAAKATGELLRIQVGTEKGLTPKQAARLQGSTKEELEADADEILETFGVQKTTTDDEENEEEEEVEEDLNPRRSPVKGTNPVGGNTDGSGELDYDKIVADFNPRII